MKRLSAADCEKCSSYREGDLGCRASRGKWGTQEGMGDPGGSKEDEGVKGESCGTVLQDSKILMKPAIGFQ